MQAGGRRQGETTDVHPVKELCCSRLNTINQYKYRGVISPELAKMAKRVAQDCRDRAIADARYARYQYKKDITPEAVIAAAKKRLEQ